MPQVRRGMWKFELHGEGTVFSQVQPPAWTDNMASAEYVLPRDVPKIVRAEFEPLAKAQFQREYGAPLHSVILYPDGSIKRNARAC